MVVVPAKNYLLIHHSYGGDGFEPRLTMLPEDGDQFEYFFPKDKRITLRVNPDARFCTGWHDLATGESFPCPDAATLNSMYNQCRHCQQKTGFNPAFYHASSVSQQQQTRNAQPHFLYLAHFAPGVIKVGISWANRGIARLLDQGARSGLLIKTYPTATQARQYEAKIAALAGIAETLQVSAKHKLLSLPYDAEAAAAELIAARNRIKNECNVTPDDHQPETFDEVYTQGAFDPLRFVSVTTPAVSGRALGMIGSTLIAEQNDTHYGLSLHKFLGCRVMVSEQEEQIAYGPQQARLF